MKSTTTIGSMPHETAEPAVNILLQYIDAFPGWPQLPKINFREQMVPQYAEGFPGIVYDEASQNVYVDTAKAYEELEHFYTAFIEMDFEYFGLSREFAAGFGELLKRKPPRFKSQTVGPVTFAMMLKDESARSIFFNAQFRDAAIKQIVMKSIWQLRTLKKNGYNSEQMMLFLDEPYLSAYGSAFGISRDDVVNSIKETKDEIKKNLDVQIGVHCCGNTDWSLLYDSGIDILSFDAYSYFDSILLYPEELDAFLKKGGRLAWGVVPTTSELVIKENSDSLLRRLNDCVSLLTKKGFLKEDILRLMILTPSCGMGSLTEELSEKVLSLLKEVAEKL